MDIRRIGQRVSTIPHKNVFTQAGKRAVEMILAQEKYTANAMQQISEIVRFENYITYKRITPPNKTIH